MTNFEIKEGVAKEKKELSPEVLSDYVRLYPGLKTAYDELLEAVFLMNQILQEYSQNRDATPFEEWNKRQTEAHDNLIDKLVEFIDDLEKFDSEEAELLRLNYNNAKEKRLLFTQLALKFLKRKAS